MTESSADRVLLEIEAERFAKEVGIPPCPTILVRFAAEIRSSDPDLRKIAGLIANDVGLSAAMLSMVNSPYYGLAKRATSVQQALSILGLRAGANIVTGLMLKFAFPTSESRLMQRFWDESSRISDEAHTYVLFRDCGIPTMLRKFAVYGEVFEANRKKSGKQLIAVEDNRFRFNHAHVGFALARSWLLPDSMCKSILYHHQPELATTYCRDIEPADPRLVAFGILAEQIVALSAGGGLCPDWREYEEFVLDTLQITPEEIVVLMHDTEAIAA